ncbi:MAG: hydroxymethylglutaryl-CoA lyase, partial [Shimia sp.]
MSGPVTIVEVGPRDGLQNEARAISAAEKLALIEACAEAGLRRIEVGAMVSPRWVPQMAGTAEVLGALGATPWRQAVLVPNVKGFERLEEALADAPRSVEVAVFIAATEGFSQANLNCSVAESIERAAPVVEAATRAGHAVRGYVSCVTQCPYE